MAGSLRQTHPDCEVVWLCDRRFAPLARLCRHISHVVELEKDWKAWRAQVSALGEFDCAIDLQGLLKSAIPVALSRAKTKLGYHWQREGSRLFTQPVIPCPSSIHVVEQYLDVARAAGGGDTVDFGLVPDAQAIANAEDLIGQLPAGKKLVVCHAGAGWASKRWPAANFAALADALSDKANICFIGTKADSPAVREVIDHSVHMPVDLLGKTDIPTLAALLARADLHIAGDTGSIHIAAALGTPCIGLYTLTRPERSCPYGQVGRCRELGLDAVVETARGILG